MKIQNESTQSVSIQSDANQPHDTTPNPKDEDLKKVTKKVIDILAGRKSYDK